MKPAQDPNHTLLIKAKSAKFTKDSDWFSKMDPFIRIKLGNETQRTETAKNQGKAPKWTTAHTFKITPEQYAQAETLGIMFEAYDEDSATSADFLGRARYKLSQIKTKLKETVTLKLLDDKHDEIGTLDVDLEFKPAQVPQQPNPQTNLAQQSNQQKPAQTTQQNNPTQPVQPNIQQPTTAVPDTKVQKVIGTVMIRPGEGKFDTGGGNKQSLNLSFLHNGITCQTPISEKNDSKLLFHNPIIFQLYEGEDMSIRCIDNDPKKPGVIGEGQIQLGELVKRGKLNAIAVPLSSRIKKLGDLNLEVEFFSDVFENPVKIFPPMPVKRGESQHKKVNYVNLEKVKKVVRVRTGNKSLISIKTETLTLMPNETGEIRFEVFAPADPKVVEDKCRVDVILDDTKGVEESMLFKIKCV